MARFRYEVVGFQIGGKGVRRAPRNAWERSGPDDWLFWAALGELRSVIGFHLGMIAVMYGLEIEEDLSSILPVVPDEDEDSKD